MRKFLVPLMLIASIGASSVALAAGTMATGTIASMDAKACKVTLNNKEVYQFPAKCDLSKFKLGEKVSITYTVNGKVYEATAIKAA
jgi:hypothetical protein